VGAAMLMRAARRSWRAAARRVARRADPAWFAMVMATGIVSAALRADGLPGPAAVLLAAAAAAFAFLAAVMCWSAAAFPARLRAVLGRPDRAFTSFAAVAASSVLGNGLAAAGHPLPAGVLAGLAVLLWVALTCRILVLLATWRRDRRPAGVVNGTWYLWVVGTQSLAIAAAFSRAGGLLPARLAAPAAVAAWSAGALLYLVVTGLVVARLRLAGLPPADEAAPYWVAMGAASITVFAAARILPLAATVAAVRLVITTAALAAWVLATALIPPLAVLTAARRPRPLRPRYSPGAWVVVFPLAMYAMAGLRLGPVAGMPAIQRAGAAAGWAAAAVWALTSAAALISAAGPAAAALAHRRRGRGDRAPGGPGDGAPGGPGDAAPAAMTLAAGRQDR